MSLVSTKAFILKVDPLSEKDLVVALLTENNGVVRASARGARGKTRRAAALQLLTEVAVIYFRREGADLARVDSLEIVRSAFPLASREGPAMLLPYVAESLLTFVPESEAGEEPYRLTRHVLQALLEGGDPQMAARYFEVWLLRLAGLLPDEATCAVCGAALPPGEALFDPEIPGFVSAECAGRGVLPVPGHSRLLLARMRRSPLHALGRLAADPAALAAIEELTREIRRRFLGHELKSYRFLRSLS